MNRNYFLTWMTLVFGVAFVCPASFPANAQTNGETSPVAVFVPGFVLKEYYTNDTGDIDALIANPPAPDISCHTNLWEGDTSYYWNSEGRNYSGRISGFFVPKRTGPHTFYLAAGYRARLFLSSNDDSANKTLIAVEPTSSGQRQWTGGFSDGRLSTPSPSGGPQANISGPIGLSAGNRYYMESWFGANYLAVAAQGPDEPVPEPGSTPIAGMNLGTYGLVGNLTINTQPQSQTVIKNSLAMFTVGASDNSPGCGADVIGYQWRKDGVDIPGANSRTFAFYGATLCDAGTYSVRLSSFAGSMTSTDAVLSVLPVIPGVFNSGPDVLSFNFNSDASGMQLAGTATVADGVLKLTTAINSQYGAGSITLNPNRYVGFEVSWKSYIGGGANGGADGYSLNIGNDIPVDPGYGGEEGAGTGLTVTVDTWDNRTGADIGVEIKWRGTRIAYAPIPKDNDGVSPTYLRKSAFVDAHLTLDAAGVATMTYDGQTISATIANYSGLPANRLLFWARTGGANDNQWIDDLRIATPQRGLVVNGRVTDESGNGLSGASIKATVGQMVATQATTDANGNYAMSCLSAGVYALTASASRHAKSSRVLTLSAGTAAQNFQLASLAANPALVSTNRQPAAFVFPPIGSLGEQLMVFNGSVFSNITPTTRPSLNRMTIVLTHGWIPQALGHEVPNAGIEGWATTIANSMKAQGVTTNVANILALDWRYAAQGTLPPEENIPGEGVLLGQSLQRLLGDNYAQPVHFMGHSLGAQVNAAAANYLHGDRTAQQPVSPTPWTAAPMHMTLFDHAEISRIVSFQVLWDGLTLDLGSPTDVLKYAAKTLQGWKPSLPVRYEWADNYISLVGFYLPNTLNVALQKAVGLVGPIDAHSYPMAWYDLSIAYPNSSANPLGFKRSHEYSQLPGAILPFPPSIGELSPGDAYHQTPMASDQLALEPLPLQNFPQLIVPLFGNGPDAVVQVVEGAIQVVGTVVAEVKDAAVQAGERVTQGFDYAANKALQGGQAVVNLHNSPVLRLLLRTQGISLPSPLALRHGPLALNAAGGGEPASPPMAWLPIQFPANATAMAFDFMVEGNPMDDVLVCGIGETNLFSLEAKYIPTNTISASRLIDVSTWVGTTNELFFGFMGGTSSNATLIIENIRFYSLTEPRLDISMSGDVSLLSWPSTAGGYVVEATTSLASPTWEALTNAPMISADRYVLTNPRTEQSRFFRLRAR